MYNVVWKQYKEEKHIRQVGYCLDTILLSGVIKVQSTFILEIIFIRYPAWSSFKVLCEVDVYLNY